MIEMELAETSPVAAQKFQARMIGKNEQVPIIKMELKHFKNLHFKQRVAEMCQWCLLQSGHYIIILFVMT